MEGAKALFYSTHTTKIILQKQISDRNHTAMMRRIPIHNFKALYCIHGNKVISSSLDRTHSSLATDQPLTQHGLGMLYVLGYVCANVCANVCAMCVPYLQLNVLVCVPIFSIEDPLI